MLSFAALGDCNFVTVNPGIDVSGRPDGNVLVKALGLVSFEHPDGTCYWYNDGGDIEEQILAYFDWLGEDWEMARLMGCVGAAGGVIFFLLSIMLCCSSHFLGIRFFLACLLGVGLPLFQSLTFLAFMSDVCQDRECGFSRSAGWSVGAAVCFMGSGLCYSFMSDYPGRLRTTKSKTAAPKPMLMREEKAPAGKRVMPIEEESAPVGKRWSSTEEDRAPVERCRVPSEEDAAPDDDEDSLGFPLPLAGLVHPSAGILNDLENGRQAATNQATDKAELYQASEGMER